MEKETDTSFIISIILGRAFVLVVILLTASIVSKELESQSYKQLTPITPTPYRNPTTSFTTKLPWEAGCPEFYGIVERADDDSPALVKQYLAQCWAWDKRTF
jgi:hypothetical protein